MLSILLAKLSQGRLKKMTPQIISNKAPRHSKHPVHSGFFTADKLVISLIFIPLLFMLLFVFQIKHAIAASENVSNLIDFGIEIFCPHIKDDFSFKNLKNILDTETKNIPLHAYALSKYVALSTAGTKALGDSSAAVEKLISLITQRFDPQNTITIFDRAYLFMIVANLGYPNYNSKNYAWLALSDMAVLLQLEPLNPYYHLFYTVIYASLKEHEISEFKLYDPLEELKKALSFEMADPQFHYLVGSTFCVISNDSPDIHQLAFAEFMHSLKLAPKNNLLKEKIYKTLIDLLAGYDQRKTAKPFWLEESVYTYLIEKGKDTAAAHNNLGFLYTMNNIKLEEALEHCQKAVASNPKNAVFLDSLGCAYYKNKDTKKAIETLLKAYSISPDSRDINEHLAEIYLQQNNNMDAIKHLEFILNLEPRNALANNNIGYVLADSNVRLEDALKFCQTAVEAEPDNAVYLDSLAWATFKNSKISEALELIEKALKKDPGIGALYMHKGDILFYCNKINEAIECYKIGLQLDPNFPSGIDNLSYLCTIRVAMAKLSGGTGRAPLVKQISTSPFDYSFYNDYLNKIFETAGIKVDKSATAIDFSKAIPEKTKQKIEEAKKAKEGTRENELISNQDINSGVKASSEVMLKNSGEVIINNEKIPAVKTSEIKINKTTLKEFDKELPGVKMMPGGTTEILKDGSIEIKINNNN